MYLKVFGGGIFLILTSLQPAAAELDALIASCNDCHGEAGVSQWNDVPTIAGIDPYVHADALWAYQDDARPCATGPYRLGDTSRTETNMCEAVAALNDEQIEALAAHYAALPFVPAPQEFDTNLAQQGNAVHDRACKRCHSDGGSNPDDEASILAGQWMGYLEATFAQYAAGTREQPDKMKEKMDELAEGETQALIHYYASQQ